MEFDINELAKAKGLKTYDTALPVDWYDDVYAKTGYWPQHFGFVWCYDKPSVWGEPVPLTEQAEILLSCYKKLSTLSAENRQLRLENEKLVAYYERKERLLDVIEGASKA